MYKLYGFLVVIGNQVNKSTIEKWEKLNSQLFI